MHKSKFDFQNIRVASPCSVGWETMTGDARVRHCDSCRLNIYNTAEMTGSEIETLIQNREGRLCVRLHRRPDGTLLTKDCPVGLRAVQKRVTKFAGACLATIVTFFSYSYTQDKELKPPNGSSTTSERNQNEKQESELTGTVLDAHGAVVPGAVIWLYNENVGKKGNKKDKTLLRTMSDSNGTFKFEKLANGTYKIEVTASGFKKSIYKNVITIGGRATELNIILEVAGETVTVGIYAEPALIVMTSSSITTVITLRKRN